MICLRRIIAKQTYRKFVESLLRHLIRVDSLVPILLCRSQLLLIMADFFTAAAFVAFKMIDLGVVLIVA